MNFFSSKTLAYAALCVAVAASAFWAGRISGVTAGKSMAAASNSSTTSPSRYGAVSSAATNSAAGLSLNDLLNAKGKPNAQLLADWAKNLTPDEIASALKSLQGMPAGLQRDAILGAVINAWATGDPQGFLANAGNVSVPRMREGGVDSALRTWAEQDPKSALDWLKQNPGSAPPSALAQRYASAMAGFAATDPQGALTTVAGLSTNTAADLILRNNALQAVTNALADSGNFSGAVAMFSQLPAGQMQTMAYNNLVQQWAASSPEDASAWIGTLTDPNQRSQLGARVAQTWAASDPVAAATWAAQMDQQSATASTGGNAQNSDMLASAISSWAAYDIDAPAQFLNQLPAGPGKDDAVAIFAMRAGEADASGATQWVSTIADDQLRARAATAVAFEMLQQDPNAASQYLANTTYIPDQTKQALQNMPPNMANRIGYAMAGGGFGGGGFGGGGGGGNAGGQQTTGGLSPIDNGILTGNGPIGNFMNGGGFGGGGRGGAGGGRFGGGGGGGGFGGGGGGGGGGG